MKLPKISVNDALKVLRQISNFFNDMWGNLTQLRFADIFTRRCYHLYLEKRITLEFVAQLLNFGVNAV